MTTLGRPEIVVLQAVDTLPIDLLGSAGETMFEQFKATVASMAPATPMLGALPLADGRTALVYALLVPTDEIERAIQTREGEACQMD